MYDFIFIVLIILEAILTPLCVMWLLNLEKKVIKMNETLELYHQLILEVNKKVKPVLSSLNKFIAAVTSKKFSIIKKVIKYSISAVEIIILIRSLNLSKGVKLINYKVLKKLLYSYVIKQVVKTFIFS